MGLFKLENHLPVINTEIRAIPEIKKIIARDKDRKKTTAFAELLYIFFVYDYKSPYTKYSYDERKVHARRACQLPDTWKEDKDIKAAVKLYRDLQESPAIKSLQNTKEALLTSSDVIQALRKTIDSELEALQDEGRYVAKIISEDDYDSTDEYEAARKAEAAFTREEQKARAERITALVDQVKLLITLSAKLPEAITAVEELEEKVKQEQASGRQLKGKASVGLFEE